MADDPEPTGSPEDADEGAPSHIENPRRAIATVFAIVFVDLLGFGILIPIIPLYVRSFGASEFVVGLLVAAYSLFQFFGAPILGRLSDERGRRPVLLISLAGSTIAWTLFGLAHALWVLFVARILAGLMGGNIATAQAYMADITAPEDRARGLGLLGAAFGLGFVFGPALGGVFSAGPVVASVDGLVPAVVPITEFTLPSFVAAGVTGLNLVAAFFVLPETRPEGSVPDERSRVQRLRESLSDPTLRGLILAFFLFSLAFSGMESMFVLFTKDLYGFGPAANGYLLAYLGVVIAIVQGGLVGRLTEVVGERRLAIVGVGIELFALSLLPFSPALGSVLPALGPLPVLGTVLPGTVTALLVVVTVLSVGNGFANVSLNTLVSRSAGADEQGGAFGLTQSAGSLARTGGPIIAGALYAAVTYWLPFVVAGLLMLPILAVLVSRRFREGVAVPA
ncbi:MAG: DHA1 family tetracycline resistance protein-like MFS transporter [Natronomonas sp.]|jgi:DHA1 family tetracycline resistance protein-like MFS transporter